MSNNKLYVVGHPVAHSKSPVMHNALYRALGLDWTYELKDIVDPGQARDFLSSGAYLGVNITMPFKPHAFEVADVKDPSAVLAQGANVLFKNAQGKLTCYNMDGLGCVSYLQSKGVNFAGANVVVCGTGPTSLAIMHAAAMAQAKHVMLTGRSSAKATAVLDGYLARLAQTDDAGLSQQCGFSAGTYDRDNAAISAANIIVDATPLGMSPGDPAVFDTTLLHAGQSVFDVVYGHGETALAAGAQAAGCLFFDGSGMLVSQAVLGAWEFLRAGGQESLPSYEEAFAIMEQAAGFAC